MLALTAALLLVGASPGHAWYPGPWWDPYPYWWYPPPYHDYPPYYYTPPAIVIEPPPVYIERPAPAAYWYYCASAGAYYPSVSRCPEAWILVPPRP
jgi:hypothetical protein